MTTPFPDRSKKKVVDNLAKHAGQYLRPSQNDLWEEAATGTKLAAGQDPPTTVAGPCGYIVWQWDGSAYSIAEKHCKIGCRCDATPPTDTTGPMPVGAQFTKPC